MCINSETISGLLIIIASSIAIYLSSSNLKDLYVYCLEYRIYDYVSFDTLVRDILMIIFFLHVALDLKKEMIVGVLRDKKNIALPLFAALGGMIIPACIYLYVNRAYPEYYIGFGIPCATDIAFAVGIFNLITTKASKTAKFFLLSIAIFDDIGAILLVVICYSKTISLLYIMLSCLIIGVLMYISYRQIDKLYIYLILGSFLSIVIHLAGIHSTIAGVIVGFLVPFRHSNNDVKPPLVILRNAISPFVSFIILPLFAFAACNLDVSNINMTDMLHPIGLGVFLGLFIGKQIGVLSFSYIAIKCKFGQMGDQINVLEMYAVSILCGIGFTMSIFIASLALPLHMNVAQMGLIASSILSAFYGSIVLKLSQKRHG